MNALALLLAAALAASASTTPQGLSEHQKELIKSMEHWTLVVPADAQDPALRALALRLGVLRKRAGDAPLDAAGSKLVQTDFDTWKDDLAQKLAQSTGRTDFTQYRADLEKGVHGLALYAEDKALGLKDDKKMEASLKQLKPIVGPMWASYYFDRAKAKSGVGMLAAARAEGTTDRFFNFRGWVGQPRIIKPDGVIVPTVAPAAISSDRLSDIISGVSKTARKYADKVADTIVAVSKKYGIDEKLQAAFVWAESAFNPNAKSYAGAMGLGQLMPGTAKALGVTNAYDIDQNLGGSAKFIDQLLEKFATPDEIKYTQGLFAAGRDKIRSGRSADEVWSEIYPKIPVGVGNAIAAYNAGPGAITRYAKGDWRNLPVTQTAEAKKAGKGYWQTLHYTPKVLRNWFDITVKSQPSAFA